MQNNTLIHINSKTDTQSCFYFFNNQHGLKESGRMSFNIAIFLSNNEQRGQYVLGVLLKFSH